MAIDLGPQRPVRREYQQPIGQTFQLDGRKRFEVSGLVKPNETAGLVLFGNRPNSERAIASRHATSLTPMTEKIGN
jgi:hypothetical protein